MTELPPPALIENGSYENWRSEIQMWQITTTMEPKRQALAVRAKLTGKVREEALKIDAADLNNENGMSFLVDTLDKHFGKSSNQWNAPNENANGRKVKKWDVPGEANNGNGHNISMESNLSAAERARQRAAELSNKLAAEGKYQTPPMSILPNTNSAIPSLMNIKACPPHQVAPEVKKMENGNSFAEFNINDVCARPFLTRSSTRELIAQQSGAAISLRGRFLTNEDKKQQAITGSFEKPLVYMIQANVAAKVQVAIHKVMEVCRNYEKFGADNNFNNYGLTNNASANSSHHFVQDKLFVGLDIVHPEFNLKDKLAGENGANFSFMVQQTGAKVFLRGRGSGYVEPNSGRESFEALHIYISHPRQDGLDMARQLCESLIETILSEILRGQHQLVKSQYQEWNAQRMVQPPPSSAYPINQDLRYPVYPQSNGFNAPYGGLPRGHHPMENNRMPVSVAQAMYPTSHLMNGPPSLMDQRPRLPDPTGPVNDFRVPESNFDANQHRDGFHEDAEYRERQSGRSRRRNRSRSRSRSRSPDVDRSRSPDKKSSRSRDRSDDRSSGRRDSSPSPNYQESPRRKFKEASPGRRDSRSDSSSRRDSPPRSSSRKESSSNRRESPERKDERRRKFTEEPKKRRKFSEDPRLLEQSKAVAPVEDNSEERTTLEMLQGKSNSSKLQFRSKKSPASPPSPSRSENTKKTKSILKMAPPPMVPILPSKGVGKSKSVKISPAGLAVKKKTTFKEDIFMPPPPPIEKLKPPSPPKPQQKALKMGALSTLAMYDDSDDDD